MTDTTPDALVALLPPTVDPFTYLTLIETTLPQTPHRLATLHDILLNHPSLTNAIGWDLVKVLLPLLDVEGESANHAAANARRCLDDVARLGNPREVILAVCENLLKLSHEAEEDAEKDAEDEDVEEGNESAEDDDNNNNNNRSARHLTASIFRRRFVALLEMLPILHMRLKAVAPSRFVANTLHAALSAYHAAPTPPATAAILAFLRCVSGVAPKDKPSLPPRTPASSASASVSASTSVPTPTASRAAPPGPDPEADERAAHGDEKAREDEALVIQRLSQFALVEVLKIFAADFGGHDDDDDEEEEEEEEEEEVEPLRWAMRLVGNTRASEDSQPRHPGLISVSPALKQRYAVVEKIVALSDDLHINDAELLDIIRRPSTDQPPPLDFDELPRTAEEISFERHGALVLLAARASTRAMSPIPTPTPAHNSQPPPPLRIPVLPDLAAVFGNFTDELGDASAPGQQDILVDSLLSLLLISMGGEGYGDGNKRDSPASHNEQQQQQQQQKFMRDVIACIGAPLYRDRSVMKSVSYRAFKAVYPTDEERFGFFAEYFESGEGEGESESGGKGEPTGHALGHNHFFKENALDWFKQEIIDADTSTNSSVFSPATLARIITAIYSRKNVPAPLLRLAGLAGRNDDDDDDDDDVDYDAVCHDWTLALDRGAVHTCLVALNLYVFLARNRKLREEKLDIRCRGHGNGVHDKVASGYLQPLKECMELVVRRGGGGDGGAEESGSGDSGETLAGLGAAELALYLVGEIERCAGGGVGGETQE